MTCKQKYPASMSDSNVASHSCDCDRRTGQMVLGVSSPFNINTGKLHDSLSLSAQQILSIYEIKFVDKYIIFKRRDYYLWWNIYTVVRVPIERQRRIISVGILQTAAPVNLILFRSRVKRKQTVDRSSVELPNYVCFEIKCSGLHKLVIWEM